MDRAAWLVSLTLTFAGAFAETASAAGTIAATSDAACAVVDGEVTCWGQIDSIFGRRSSIDAPADPPMKLPGLRSVVVLDVIAGHACAARADGRVVCFGTNQSGELGSGNYRSGGRRVVRGVDHAVDVAVGGSTNHRGGDGFACALSEDKVYCWGSNRAGQLGRSGLERSPSAIRVPVDLTASIEAGEDFACARDTVGDVRCWGAGDFNARLVARKTTSMDVNGDRICVVDTEVRCGELDSPLAKVKLPLGQVSAGVDHTCVRADDRVHCAGANWGGALGKAGEAAGEIATGFQFTCARSATAVTCWGNNYTGALGTPPAADEPRARPPQTVSLTAVKRF